ncbi:MAG: hypothetical protein H6681_05820 [Desulfobacteraceae bacterium]|nr:hypothetical protein [Desulfobacteraceae bacterium]
MKKNVFFICIVLIFICSNTYALEKIDKEELKKVTGQTGISDNLNSSQNSSHSPSHEQENQTQTENISVAVDGNLPGTFVIHRGAGVSIFVDDVVLLFRSVPDTTYWDTDGVM